MPSAPCLLPELTGGWSADLAGVRDAVDEVLSELVATVADRVVVAARREPGSMAGFGAGLSRLAGADGGFGWAHELGALLLLRRSRAAGVDFVDATGTVAGAAHCAGSLSAATARTAVLVLADASTTRGPRAPGAEDPRGELVDAQLERSLRSGRLPLPGDAAATAVGCRGLPGFTLFSSLRLTGDAGPRVGGPGVWEPGAGGPGAKEPNAGTGSWPADVRYVGAPAGVGYLVAVRHRPT